MKKEEYETLKSEILAIVRPVLEKAAKDIVVSVIEEFLDPPKKSRAVSVKAKNLVVGDVIEWPWNHGPQVVNTVTAHGDRVCTIAAERIVPWAFFDPEERVRVYRGVS